MEPIRRQLNEPLYDLDAITNSWAKHISYLFGIVEDSHVEEQQKITPSMRFNKPKKFKLHV